MQTIVLGRRAARTGEEDLADVFAMYHASLVRLAYLLCSDQQRAEDAVADAFVKVFRGMRRGTVRNVGPYLRRAVVNEVNSRFRRLALERREAQRRWGDERGVRHVDDQIADADALFSAMQHLPQRQRTALVLRYYADMSEADIASAMGVSTGTVKSTIFRGLEKLRRHMGEEVS